MNKENKCKELLKKIKQIPDDAIEGAIDSLYTEYIKEAKEYIEHEIKNNKLINGYTDIYIFQTEIELLLKYIQHLEQKESILDKVTDKLKEENEKDKKTVQYYEKAYRTAKKNNNKFYMKSHKRKIDMSNARREARKEILNIIEQKQYCCNCGVELNSENKALDNMCNECKYRIRLLKGRKEIMEDKIKKCIDKIECITRYMSTILVLILATLGKTRENNTFYAVGFTIVVCEIIEMTILAYLYRKISDVFFEEKNKRVGRKKENL